MLQSVQDQLTVRLAETDEDIAAIQRLRYDVFVKETGSDGPGVDHDAGLETDEFDNAADHLMLIDTAASARDQVVGTYRLMTRQHADKAGGFYAAREFTLTNLENQPGGILELGRSCIARDYRGGTGLLHLWQGIGAYVADKDIDVLFGTASFWGTQVAQHAAALRYLFENALAPESLQVTARAPEAVDLAQLQDVSQERRAAMLQMPALIKSYLRLGGVVSNSAYIDHAFNTVDVCMILEVAQMSARQRALYGG